MVTNGVIAFALLCSVTAFGQSSGYFEEAGTLESIYEARARAILNTFLRPTEYTIVVAGDLRKDDGELKKYRDHLDSHFLPGMPMAAEVTSAEANNFLHNLKSSIKVHVVLNVDVSPEKEKVISDILKSKLHLDELSGDSLVIQRASFPKDDPIGPALLPDFSWRMWTLVVVVALLLVAGLLFLAARRRKDSEAMTSKEVRTSNSSFGPSDSVKPPAEPAALPDEHSVSHREKQRSELRRGKDQIMSLASEFPNICSEAISNLIENEAGRQVMITFETIGWELSRKMFQGVPVRGWAALAGFLQDSEGEIEIEESISAVKLVGRELLTYVLRYGISGDRENPFDFLFQLKKEVRNLFLAEESESNLAIMGVYVSREQMSDFLEDFPIEKQQGVMVQLARLKELPEEIVKRNAHLLAERIRALAGKSLIKTEGPSLAAQLLRRLKPETEMAIVRQLRTAHPEEAEEIRLNSVQFEDIPRLPMEYVKPALDDLELDVFVKALSQSDREVVSGYLQLLPSKKAQTVRKDLMYFGDRTSINDIATARRTISQKVEERIRLTGQNIRDVWREAVRQVA